MKAGIDDGELIEVLDERANVVGKRSGGSTGEGLFEHAKKGIDRDDEDGARGDRFFRIFRPIPKNIENPATLFSQVH